MPVYTLSTYNFYSSIHNFTANKRLDSACTDAPSEGQEKLVTALPMVVDLFHIWSPKEQIPLSAVTVRFFLLGT